MYISWLGYSCFKIEEKLRGDNSVTLVTDPYGKSVGLRLSKTKADIVTVSHQHEGHNNVEEISGVEEALPLVFDRPGEYEVKDVFIQGIGSYHDKKEGVDEGKSTIFRFDVGGVNVVHLGDLGVMLSNQQIDKLGDIDILLIPVGGKKTLDAKEAAELVRILEPRIVIPMHYKVEGMDGDLDGLEKFKKEMGEKAEVLPKLKISKKDLPQEEIKLVILERA